MRRPAHRILTAVLLLIAAGLAGGCGSSDPQPAQSSISTGEAAPAQSPVRPATEQAAPPAGNVTELTDANFAEEVEQPKRVCLVDFWATWCAPCRIVAPTVEALSDEYSGRASVFRLDVDAQRATAERFKVTAIPTLIIFKDGKPTKRHVGVTSKDDLKAGLEEALKN
jgi:thioredoxin 1